MKKITLSIIAIIGLAISANAQIQKGNVMIGGDLADLSLGLNGSKVFSFNISPRAAWFVKDNVALGAYAKFGLQTAKNTPTATNYGVGALGRYYTGSDALEVLRHGRIFGEATVGIGGTNVSKGASTNGLDFSFGPGFAYFITPNLGLETLLKYNGTAGFGNVGYQNNLNLSFGIQIYLPGKSTVRKIEGDIK